MENKYNTTDKNMYNILRVVAFLCSIVFIVGMSKMILDKNFDKLQQTQPRAEEYLSQMFVGKPSWEKIENNNISLSYKTPLDKKEVLDYFVEYLSSIPVENEGEKSRHLVLSHVFTGNSPYHVIGIEGYKNIYYPNNTAFKETYVATVRYIVDTSLYSCKIVDYKIKLDFIPVYDDVKIDRYNKFIPGNSGYAIVNISFLNNVDYIDRYTNDLLYYENVNNINNDLLAITSFWEDIPLNDNKSVFAINRMYNTGSKEVYVDTYKEFYESMRFASNVVGAYEYNEIIDDSGVVRDIQMKVNRGESDIEVRLHLTDNILPADNSKYYSHLKHLVEVEYIRL